MMPSNESKFKVVLKFNLRPGAADEELRRSHQQFSFPRMLAEQPGCERIELIKVDDSTTLSVQTWTNQRAWWAALEIVKQAREGGQSEAMPTDEILVSRDFIGGTIEEVLCC